jgi:hypothetical protein
MRGAIPRTARRTIGETVSSQWVIFVFAESFRNRALPKLESESRMAVKKYKPATHSRLLEGNVHKTVTMARGATASARKTIQQARSAVKKSKYLCTQAAKAIEISKRFLDSVKNEKTHDSAGGAVFFLTRWANKW